MKLRKTNHIREPMKNERLYSANSIQLQSVTGGYLKFKTVFNKHG